MSDTILNTGTTVNEVVENKEAPAAVENTTTEAVVTNNEIVPEKVLKDILADEFKEVKSLQNFKDINDLAKSYLNLNGLLGKKVSDWAKEDIEGLLGKLGRPEAADKYTLPDELGEGAEKIKELAFKAGLSQEQAKRIADELILENRTLAEVQKKAAEDMKLKAETELKTFFGDAYEKRLKIAEKAIKDIGGDALLNSINENGLGLNPELIKAFAKVGVEFLEADKVVHSDKISNFGITPVEARNRIELILAQPHSNKAYFDKFHPEHRIVTEEVRKLGEVAYGNIK